MTTYYAFADSWRSIAMSNGIKPVTFHARIRRGMKPEEAATKPVRPYFQEWRPPGKLNSGFSQTSLDDRGD